MSTLSPPTRGRPSKVDLLPDDLKAQLHALLRDKANTQTDILDAVNDLIDAEGLDEALKLSRSGLNRYATSMEKVGSRIRDARAISEQWMAKFGESSGGGEVGKISLEIVRTLAYDISMKMMDDTDISAKEVNNLALALARLERAASASQKRELEWRKEFAVEAADAIEETAKAQGLTLETIQAIKDKLLGMA